LDNLKEIRLSKASLGNEELVGVQRVFDNEYLGMGKEVSLFEQELRQSFDREVRCVSSGTAALHLALQAIGVSDGDEVLVQSLTYLSSFQAITATGGIAIPCDVCNETLTINPVDLEAKITGKTKAIMPVHYGGGVGELDTVYEIANKYGLRVIEDAAHAFGSTYKNRLVGSFGDIACFSFDGIKNITSGEGGCIVTSDRAVIDAVSDSRLLGVKNDSQNRLLNKRTWRPKVDSQGWRYHMSDIMAAIGRAQFSKIGEFAKKRKSHLKRYQRNLFNNLIGARMVNLSDEVVPHIMPLILAEHVDRVAFIECMEKLGVQCGIHYYPNHYLNYFDNNSVLTVTDMLSDKIFSLPMHVDLTESDIDYVCDALICNLKKFDL
jgi:dTDP-4-amino-4,6-dideoxygalactose transaminase